MRPGKVVCDGGLLGSRLRAAPKIRPAAAAARAPGAPPAARAPHGVPRPPRQLQARYVGADSCLCVSAHVCAGRGGVREKAGWEH